MDEYKATKVLAKELAKHNGQIIIYDQNYMKKLLDESEHVSVLGNPVEFGAYFSFSKPRQIFYDLTNEDKFPNLEEFIKNNLTEEANYLFDSRNTISNSSFTKGTLVPYSIIGSKEIEDVKRLFYKNYDLEIRGAVSSLGIKDYFELYRVYSFEDSETFFQKYLGFPMFKKETIEFLKQIKFDKDSEIHVSDFEGIHNVENINSTLKKFGIDFSLQPKNNNWIQKQDTINLIKILKEENPKSYNLGYDPNDNKLTYDFCKFVFEMPYEDQNIESNKWILKHLSPILDKDVILLREFQGKHFKGYFEVLNENDQKRIAGIIKNSGMKNTANNSFLWSKGFKEVNLDYINIYKEDSDGFIEYFKTQDEEEKKIILKGIMNCAHTNKVVTDWLHKNEIDLVREASFSDEK